MTALTLKPLRTHQQRAIDDLKHSILAGHRRPMLQAPTGAGKTVIAAHIVAGARAKGKRLAFCVPSIGLIDQTFERFVENGIDPAEMGVIQGDHPWKRTGAPIQIATAQSLARRDRPDVDLVVIDEAHVMHRVYQAWMDDRPDLLFVGLSATPWSKGLGKRFDDLIRPTSTQELIDLGLLSKFRVFAPSHPDLSGVRTVAGDYHEGDLAEAMSKAQLVADVVTQWLARGEDRPTLCFAVNRAHAQLLAMQFTEAGVSTAYVDANTPREEREEIGKRLASGAVKVVCNIGCLTTGIDWDVRCLILARPTKSDMLFVQIVGRALRTAPGKDHAIILDHSDTHMRLGMVTDIDHEALDDGKPTSASDRKKREKAMPTPRECNACAALIPALMRECPCCGTVQPPRTGVQVNDGDLEEIGSGRSGSSVRAQIAADGKSAVYGQLMWFAEERGRSHGWAAHTYKDIFGVWPRGLPKYAGHEPTPLMRSWLRSRDIAFAKAKQNTSEVRHAV
jgi:DNA repair protein RadD